ncbi:LysR family transcriptional regulator [Pantoea ananatis]
MERLKGMSIFAKVVELGSFTAAARQLHLSVSSITARLSPNWKMRWVKLLNRSTRSIGTTEAGKIYYQGCRRMLAEANQVHEQLYAFNQHADRRTTHWQLFHDGTERAGRYDERYAA